MGALLYKHRFNLVAASIGLLVTIMLWQSGTPTFIKKPTVEKRQADIYIDELTTEKFDASGKTVYRLRADRAQHWPDTDETTLIEPQIMYYAPQIWYTHAHSGTIHPDAEKITLENGVNLHREAGSAQLMTPYLYIEPDAKIASTPAPVKLITPDGVTDAKGLKVDMAEDRIKLLSLVAGEYRGVALQPKSDTNPAETSNNNAVKSGNLQHGEG